MAEAGSMKDHIKILFNHGVSYVVEDNLITDMSNESLGRTLAEINSQTSEGELLFSPLQYAANIYDDQALVDLFVKHMGADV